MKKISTLLKETSFSNKESFQSKCNDIKVVLSSDFSTAMPATVRFYKKFTNVLVTSITTEGLLTLCKYTKYIVLYYMSNFLGLNLIILDEPIGYMEEIINYFNLRLILAILVL